MRKRCPRRPVNPVPPWLRPRLSASQQLDLGLVHWQNLDQIAKGQGTPELLWQVFGGTLTWWRVADLLHRRNRGYEPALLEMRAQLEVALRLAERFKASGRVVFTGEEYTLAKRGCDVMDALARTVDQPTAVAAAQWSEARVVAMTATTDQSGTAARPTTGCTQKEVNAP
jgi:hypothetical protein